MNDQRVFYDVNTDALPKDGSIVPDAVCYYKYRMECNGPLCQGYSKGTPGLSRAYRFYLCVAHRKNLSGGEELVVFLPKKLSYYGKNV